MATEKLCIDCSSWSEGATCAACGATKPNDSPSRLALTPAGAAERDQHFADHARRAEIARREARKPPLPRPEASDDPVRCRKCSSEQFVGVPKGYSVVKGVLGFAIVGPVGLLGGALGASKVRLTCARCGYRWTP